MFRRFVAAIVVVAFAAAVLTACTLSTEPGDRLGARYWAILETFTDHPRLVDSSIDGSAYYSGEIAESATDDDIRNFVVEAIELVATEDEAQELVFSLRWGAFELIFGFDGDLRPKATEAEMLSDFESWNLFRLDERVDGGEMKYREASIRANSRDDALDVAAEFYERGQQVTVAADRMAVYSCGLDESAQQLSRAVIDDAVVTWVELNFCDAVLITTDSAESTLAMAARVRTFAADSGVADTPLFVGYGGAGGISAGANTDGARLAVSRFSPEMAEFLADVWALAAPSTTWLSTSGILRLVVDDFDSVGAVAADVMALPGAHLLSALRAGDGFRELQVTDAGQTASAWHLLAELAALDTGRSLYVGQDEISFPLGVDDVQETNGRAAIDLIVASGMWSGRTVTIEDRPDDGVVIVDGEPQPTTTPVGAALSEYWLTAVGL